VIILTIKDYQYTPSLSIGNCHTRNPYTLWTSLPPA